MTYSEVWDSLGTCSKKNDNVAYSEPDLSLKACSLCWRPLRWLKMPLESPVFSQRQHLYRGSMSSRKLSGTNSCKINCFVQDTTLLINEAP